MRQDLAFAHGCVRKALSFDRIRDFSRIYGERHRACLTVCKQYNAFRSADHRHGVSQLIGAANVPASVLYPLVTGGSVVLSAVAGLLFFKEKPDKISGIGLLLSFAATFLFLF